MGYDSGGVSRNPGRPVASNRAYLILLWLSFPSTRWGAVFVTLACAAGDDIEWHTLEEGKALAKETGKPLMVIVHKSWCGASSPQQSCASVCCAAFQLTCFTCGETAGACKRLKPQFAQSEDIKAYSKNFIMVNTEDNEEPTEEMYKPVSCRRAAQRGMVVC